jgi:hypothetical protein
VNAFDNSVVPFRIVLRSGIVLKVHLIEHLPVGNLVMVAGLMTFAIFIGETALGVPTHQPAKVVA